MGKIKLGKYKHYKGKEYEVLGFANHSETMEKLVIYQAQYGNRKIWARPMKMWNNTVNVNGIKQKRFAYLEKNNGEIINNIFENEKVKIEKIISNREISKQDFWYDNDIDEFVTLLSGVALLEFEDKKLRLKANDKYYIKAHEKHRVNYTSNDCVWLCVYIK